MIHHPALCAIHVLKAKPPRATRHARRSNPSRVNAARMPRTAKAIMADRKEGFISIRFSHVGVGMPARQPVSSRLKRWPQASVIRVFEPNLRVLDPPLRTSISGLHESGAVIVVGSARPGLSTGWFLFVCGAAPLIVDLVGMFRLSRSVEKRTGDTAL
jgi:hypothetical protein